MNFDKDSLKLLGDVGFHSGAYLTSKLIIIGVLTGV